MHTLQSIIETTDVHKIAEDFEKKTMQWKSKETVQSSGETDTESPIHPYHLFENTWFSSKAAFLKL